MKPLITIEFLQGKLNRGADPYEIDCWRKVLAKRPLCMELRNFKSGKYYIINPRELWEEEAGRPGNSTEIRDLGRILSGLYWERSALNGLILYVKEVQEYESFKY